MDAINEDRYRQALELAELDTTVNNIALIQNINAAESDRIINKLMMLLEQKQRMIDCLSLLMMLRPADNFNNESRPVRRLIERSNFPLPAGCHLNRIGSNDFFVETANRESIPLTFNGQEVIQVDVGFFYPRHYLGKRVVIGPASRETDELIVMADPQGHGDNCLEFIHRNREGQMTFDDDLVVDQIGHENYVLHFAGVPHSVSLHRRDPCSAVLFTNLHTGHQRYYLLFKLAGMAIFFSLFDEIYYVNLVNNTSEILSCATDRVVCVVDGPVDEAASCVDYAVLSVHNRTNGDSSIRILI